MPKKTPEAVSYDDLKIKLGQALADVLSSSEDNIPRQTICHYSNILYEEIKAALQMWNRHNGIKEEVPL